MANHIIISAKGKSYSSTFHRSLVATSLLRRLRTQITTYDRKPPVNVVLSVYFWGDGRIAGTDHLTTESTTVHIYTERDLPFHTNEIIDLRMAICN